MIAAAGETLLHSYFCLLKALLICLPISSWDLFCLKLAYSTVRYCFDPPLSHQGAALAHLLPNHGLVIGLTVLFLLQQRKLRCLCSHCAIQMLFHSTQLVPIFLCDSTVLKAIHWSQKVPTDLYFLCFFTLALYFSLSFFSHTLRGI